MAVENSHFWLSDSQPRQFGQAYLLLSLWEGCRLSWFSCAIAILPFGFWWLQSSPAVPTGLRVVSLILEDILGGTEEGSHLLLFQLSSGILKASNPL